MAQLVEVRVKQGVLRGQRMTPPQGPDFDAFLGVPYAKPPLKELRFKAPQPPEPWEGARPALEEGSWSIHFDWITNKPTGSEDCLYLNVYTPQVPSSVRTPVAGAPWPVMVWFHPGGFTNGNSGLREYGPEYLAARGVVLVSVTYRLGVMGFLSLGSKTLPGNAGLKDGVAALRWVQDNIAVFGGDPNRVTVFGCSAGGAFVEYLQFAPAARGLFHRAISQSASATNQWAYDDRGRERALELARVLGCDSQDDAEVLAFLQSRPAMELFDARQKVVDIGEVGHEGLVFSFLPCSEAGTEGSGEEPFLADAPRQLLNTDRFYPVPFICGFCDMEGMLTVMDTFDTEGKAKTLNRSRIFASVARPGVTCSDENLALADKDLERVVPADLKLQKGSPESKEIADGVRRIYFNGGKVTKGQYWQLYTDLLFAHGIHESARIHAAHPAGQPVYVYQFCVVGLNNRLSRFLLKMQTPPGACHGDDLGYLFGIRPPIPPEPKWEPHSIEALTRKRMTALWTNFARTGNPTPTDDPDVEGVVWEPIPRDRKGPVNYLDIGASLSLPRGSLLQERMDFWDAIYAKHYYKSK